MPRVRAEDAIQRAVFQHLKARAAPGVFAFHVPNGGYRKPREAGIMKGLGVVPGVPDIIAIHKGKVYALELKSEKGRISETQFEAIEAIRNAGGHAAVCRGLDPALRCLETWGILKGAAQSMDPPWETIGSAAQRVVDKIGEGR